MIGLFAAISAALAVAAGAFGAHGAAGPQEADWLRTGGLYQLVHAVAALAIMGTARGPAKPRCRPRCLVRRHRFRLRRG